MVDHRVITQRFGTIAGRTIYKSNTLPDHASGCHNHAIGLLLLMKEEYMVPFNIAVTFYTNIWYEYT